MEKLVNIQGTEAGRITKGLPRGFTIRDYGAWIQVLSSQGQTSLELHQDDWLFFLTLAISRGK